MVEFEVFAGGWENTPSPCSASFLPRIGEELWLHKEWAAVKMVRYPAASQNTVTAKPQVLVEAGEGPSIYESRGVLMV